MGQLDSLDRPLRLTHFSVGTDRANTALSTATDKPRCPLQPICHTTETTKPRFPTKAKNTVQLGRDKKQHTHSHKPSLSALGSRLPALQLFYTLVTFIHILERDSPSCRAVYGEQRKEYMTVQTYNKGNPETQGDFTKDHLD